MAFDFKKEYKQFYQPGTKPEIVSFPRMNYLAVYGSGDPNQEDGDYKKAVASLYGIAYTLKMSKKSSYKIEGYFDYVVPPLEGLWWQDGNDSIDHSHKEDFKWISLIRLPDFVSEKDLAWAINEASIKKKQDFSNVKFLSIEEGLCVQCMHSGPYDDEPQTIKMMDDYLSQNGYENDFSDKRRHHEIYLSDPRRTAPDKLKTIIRHPIRIKE